MDGAVLLRQQLASQLFNTGQEKVSGEADRLAACGCCGKTVS